MANIFFSSDPHFGHKNILNFIVHALDCPKRLPELNEGSIDDACGCPHMRNFGSVEEMDEFIIQEHNKVVKPPDKWYCGGDVAMDKKHIATVGRLNGHKRLMRGNHDIAPDKYYHPWFESIYATRVFDKDKKSDIILSHIPIHPESLRQGWTNVHGHVHSNVPALHFGTRYLNISLEVTDYRPLSIEEVRQRITDQKNENQRLIEARLAAMGVKRMWSDEELHTELRNYKPGQVKYDGSVQK
jgi:calcineurin-like phosphoesterase family protein